MSGAESTTGAEGQQPAPLIILVVEDEVLVRMLACDILMDGGHHALEAVDAEEALILLQARPDIAAMFTDVDMPGEINGLGLARLAAFAVSAAADHRDDRRGGGGARRPAVQRSFPLQALFAVGPVGDGCGGDVSATVAALC